MLNVYHAGYLDRGDHLGRVLAENSERQPEPDDRNCPRQVLGSLGGLLRTDHLDLCPRPLLACPSHHPWMGKGEYRRRGRAVFVKGPDVQ